jgi:hypothetical protein
MVLPIDIKQFSEQLSIGQMVPIRTEMSFDGRKEPFLSFMVKEDDNQIKSLATKPDVEMSYGCVTFDYDKKVFILFMFLRIDDQDDLTYETAFSLAEPVVLNDCNAFSKQKGIQIIFVGELEHNIIRVQLDMLHADVSAVIKIASEETDLDWSIDSYMSALNYIQSQTSGPSELYDMFKRSGGFLKVNVEQRS